MSVLRATVLGFCAAAMLCGAGALVFGLYPPAAIFGFWGLIVAAGTIFERVIYKRIETHRPGPGWERTAERFVDDQSGKTVTVFIEPATGERLYVQD